MTAPALPAYTLLHHVCAWCEKLKGIRTETQPAERIPFNGNAEELTHGVCRPCKLAHLTPPGAPLVEPDICANCEKPHFDDAQCGECPKCDADICSACEDDHWNSEACI